MTTKTSAPIGEHFGILTVLEEAPAASPTARGQRHRRMRCRCACGRLRVVYLYNLRSGMSRSCGICVKTGPRSAQFKHGKSRTPEYAAWHKMIQGCNNPKDRRYARLGGKGIRVQPSWSSFTAFLEDVGQRPSKEYVLFRVDATADFTNETCGWILRSEANRRRQRRTRGLLLDGRPVVLRELGELAGVTREAIRQRLLRGWTVRQAAGLDDPPGDVDEVDGHY